MKKFKKVWIILAVCLIISGAIISALALASLNFDFTGLSTEKFIESEQQIDQDFSNIKIDVNTSDIKFAPSNDNKCKVVFIDTLNLKHTVNVDNDTLFISIQDSRKWYEHICISLGKWSLTVYLPKETYNSLSIESDTNDITIPKDFAFTNIKIETDTGDVTLLSSASDLLDISTDTGKIEIGNIDRNVNVIKCKNIKVESDTGDVKLWRTTASDTITVQTATGDVWFYVVKASYVKVKTNTGDVEGNLYYAPTFKTNTDTGSVKVPPTKNDGVFEIDTNTGDICFKVVK